MNLESIFLHYLFSFATLLRLDAEKDYSEENSIISTKIQFWAVELARNRYVINIIDQTSRPWPEQTRVIEATSRL